MKKKIIVLIIIAGFIINSILFCQIGLNIGIESVTIDETYKKMLDDIYPDNEKEFTYVILEDGNYFVYHNTDGKLYNEILKNRSMRIYLFPEWSFQRFNDIPIFHRSVLPLGLYPLTDEYEWTNYFDEDIE